MDVETKLETSARQPTYDRLYSSSGSDRAAHEPKSMSRAHRRTKILEAYPLPPHWEAPRYSRALGHLPHVTFNILCFAANGHPTLEDSWIAVKLDGEGDDSAWTEAILQSADRLNNLLIVAGLLLTTSAVFLTTEPPLPLLIDYTLRGPYLCTAASFGLLIGAIIVGTVTAMFAVTTSKSPAWVADTVYATRFRLYCTLIVTSYPAVAVGIGALLQAFALLSSVWCGQDVFMQCIGAIALLLPVAMAVLFGIAGTVKSQTPGVMMGRQEDSAI